MNSFDTLERINEFLSMRPCMLFIIGLALIALFSATIIMMHTITGHAGPESYWLIILIPFEIGLLADTVIDYHYRYGKGATRSTEADANR